MYFFDIDKIHFNCDGYYNGKQSWLSDDSLIKIIWDTSLTPNCWRFSSTTLTSLETVINNNPSSPPINGNWNWVGYNYSISATQGECSTTQELTMIVVKNDPSCSCDAALTLYAQGGEPPYQYSFDNGVTYGNSPFKNNLCGDLSLTVMTKDSLGVVVSELIQIPPQTQSVEYDFRLVINSSQTISYPQPSEILNEYIVYCNPPLPNGVTVNFDIILNGYFERSPSINSATGDISLVVIKNGDIIPLTTDNTTNTTHSNQKPGCQGYTMYRTNYEYVYSNLTYTNTDVYVVRTNSYLLGTCQSSPPTINNLLSGTNDGSLGPLSYGQSSANSYLDCCSYSLGVSNFGVINLDIDCDCCSFDSYTTSLYE